MAKKFYSKAEKESFKNGVAKGIKIANGKKYNKYGKAPYKRYKRG